MKGERLQGLRNSGAEAHKKKVTAMKCQRGVLDARLVIGAMHQRFQALVDERVQARLLDKNLTGTGPMRLKGEQFTTGMAMFTNTELEYALKGDYLVLREGRDGRTVQVTG